MTTRHEVNFHIPAKFLIEIDLDKEFEIVWDKCQDSVVAVLEALCANTEFMQKSILCYLNNNSTRYVSVTKIVLHVMGNYRDARKEQNELLGTTEEYSMEDVEVIQNSILAFLSNNTSPSNDEYMYRSNDSTFSHIQTTANAKAI